MSETPIDRIRQAAQGWVDRQPPGFALGYCNYNSNYPTVVAIDIDVFGGPGFRVSVDRDASSESVEKSISHEASRWLYSPLENPQ